MADAQNNNWQKELMIRAAWMSYKGGCTQSEIAKNLGLSNIKVHRLLAKAQETGLVEVTIHGNPQDCMKIESHLKELYNLDHCIVAPSWKAVSNELDAIESLSEAGGQMLSNLLSNSKISKIGVGMGRTLKAAVLAMSSVKRPDLNAMSVTGSLTRKLSANPFDLVQNFVEKTGGEGYFLPVPYLAETAEEKEVFLAQKSVQSLLDKAKNAEIFLLGIGSMVKDGHLMQSGMMSAQECAAMERENVVADLMGHFITRNGEIYRKGVANHAVTFPLEHIREKHVVALAAGSSKAQATLACLKTGLINDLLIDETLGTALMQELEGQA